MSGERTEKPTEQRKKKSKEKGEGARSRELTSSAALLAGLLLLRSAAEQFVRAWSDTFSGAIRAGESPLDSSDALARSIPGMLLPGLTPLLGVMAAALLAAVAVGAMQTGGIEVHPGALAWKPGRLSAAANAKNMFSLRAVMRLMKSLLPAAAVVMIASYLLRGTVLPMPAMSYARLPTTLSAAYSLAVDAAWISVGWSALDYLNEWRTWNSGLKMSKEDIRQEMKESNGNPHTKGRIRNIQRAMRRRRVKADVSRAAVVITNPTHYAVALLFDFDNMAAPKVLVKGRDLFALEIREQARWAGVPIVENPPLARSLYRSVEEGQAIPFELYSAVAAILAFLFRQAQETAQRQSRNTAQHRSYGYAAQPRTILPVTEFEPREEAGEQ